MISGSDLVCDFFDHARKKNFKVYLLGGSKEANEMSVEKIKSKYNIKIEGYFPEYREYKPYPFDDKYNENILKRISIKK